MCLWTGFAPVSSSLDSLLRLTFFLLLDGAAGSVNEINKPNEAEFASKDAKGRHFPFL